MNYDKLAKLYDVLFSVSKRLDKTLVISEFLKNVSEKDLENIILLLQGRIFPSWDKRNIGIASSLMIKAISKITGYSEKDIEKQWKKQGDLGEVTESLIQTKKQRTLSVKQDLKIKDVIETLRKIVDIEGKGTVDKKISMIANLLSNCSPTEAKYLTRIILEDLRIGLGSGGIRDSLAWAYLPKPLPLFKKVDDLVILNTMDEKKSLKLVEKTKKPLCYSKEIEKADDILKIDTKKYDCVECKDEKIARQTLNLYVDHIQAAIDASNDIYKVALALHKHGLKGLSDIEITTSKPIKVMLALKVNNVEEGFKAIGKPAAFEYKLDGFRMQIHKKDNEIKLFTRRLEDVSKQFPDVVDIIKDHVKAKEVILDTEIVGIDPKTKQPMPFQQISQRIKRKYDIHDLIKKLPVIVFVFDAVQYNGKSYLNEPFKERRKLIEKIVDNTKNKIQVIPQIITDDEEKASAFYHKALDIGHEGVMIKMLDAPYKPGSRVGYMVKLKPIMESLDLVIVEAEYGTGKRAGWFSSFTLACYDKGKFKTIGKVGTGFKEKASEGLSFEQLTKLLKPLIRKEKGRKVELEPQVVIEVDYQEIQKSPTYDSGYALRFPRLKRLRDDKGPQQCSDLNYIKKLYASQKLS